MQRSENGVLIVGAQTSPNSLAGAIWGSFQTNGSVKLQCIGAGPVNQAIKAISIARGYAAPQGKELIPIPHFEDFIINGEKITGIVLRIEERYNR